MTVRRWTSCAGATAAALVMLVGPPPPTASAEPCPDAEVIFARGTGEPFGVGAVGQAFVDAVRAQAGGRSVGVYAVNYPASADFEDVAGFDGNVADGIRDAHLRVQFMSTSCPTTRLVLGGFSQGAAVSAISTADPAAGVPGDVAPALTPEAADHVAAVVLFGTPAGPFVPKYHVPAVDVGPLFSGKALELCAPGDGVCEGIADGGPNPAHGAYPWNGMTGEGAAFAVGRL